MSTFSSLHYHLVFSTKNRVASLKAQWRPELYAYLGGIITSLDGVPESINGIEDHVHVLVRLMPTHRICDFVREIKKVSNEWIRERARNDRFRWQDGYSIFTVAASDRRGVEGYIRNQVHHHHSQSYLDELKMMLERAGIEYDPKYLE